MNHSWEPIKQVYLYDTNPTKLTKQIEKVTKYRERKKNLNAEIKRLKNEDKDKYSRVIKRLEKKIH